jgi:hypothetical protein
MDHTNSNIIESSHDTWNQFVQDLTPQLNKLLIFHVNIRSLIRNHIQLERVISECPLIIHVIVVTEVNVSNSTKNLFNIENYSMNSELRENRRGGGILVYAHKSVTFLCEKTNTKSFECLLGQVILPSGYKTYLCAIYRPPQLSINDFIGELLHLLTKYPLNCNFITCGDINLDLKVSTRLTSSYQNTMASLGFTCCITQYTRIETTKRGTSRSCIDHIFMRDIVKQVCREQPHLINSTVVRDSLADHFITGISLTGIVANNTLTHCKLDNRRVRRELVKIDWGPVFNLQHPNDIYDFIVDNFTKVYDICMIRQPIVNSIRNNCTWLSDKLIEMSNTKNRLLQIYLNDTSNKQNELLYKKYRNKTNSHMSKAKNNFTKKEICNNYRNPKKMWQIINNLTGRVIKAVDEMLLKSFKIKARDLSDKFAHDFENNVLSVLTTCSVPLLDKRTYSNSPKVSLKINKIKENTMSQIITNINTNKGAGFDKLRARDIKFISNEMTPVLTHLVNQCISSSLYPDKLKIGLIRPIHKKGSYIDTNNYRPITILSTIDKIIEKYLGKKINDFLSSNDIIHDRQFGFQKGKNTSQLLAKFTDEVNAHLNDRKHVIVTMIDFSKAFDTLNHKILYEKLQQSGIQGPTLAWLKNYHQNRFNTVSIAGAQSELLPTTYGTAQGSIVGPTEYLLYVNDMCNIFRDASVYQFADDTCLITADSNVQIAECQMQKEFDTLCKWAHDVGLSLNYKKTKVLYVHSPYIKAHSRPNIVAHDHACLHSQQTYCNCESLELVKQHTYLGLKIDDKFNWKPHVEHVCSRLRSILGNLCILKHKMPYNTLRLLYMAMADSVINYGISSYGRTYKTHLRQICNIQIRLLKAIVPLKIKHKYRHNYTKLFQYCRVLNVFDKVKLAMILEYKDKIERLDSYNRPSNLRNLPNEPYFKIPKNNNEYGKRVWTSYLPYILNGFPRHVIDDMKGKPESIKNTTKKALIDMAH